MDFFYKDAGGGTYDFIYWSQSPHNAWRLVRINQNPVNFSGGESLSFVGGYDNLLQGAGADEVRDGLTVPSAGANVTVNASQPDAFLEFSTGKLKASVLDEDDMSSDDDTKVPTQQSAKAYVDSGTTTMTNKTLTDFSTDQSSFYNLSSLASF